MYAVAASGCIHRATDGIIYQQVAIGVAESPSRSYRMVNMQVTVSDSAQEHIQNKGGRAAVDLVSISS